MQLSLKLLNQVIYARIEEILKLCVDHIEILNLKDFSSGNVLFKPTFTSDVIFRNNFEDALSYFISGDISEDSGFAIKPWQDIKVSEVNFLAEDNFCAVMGVLNLKSLNSENQTKIAFTFVLVKNNNRIKIKIHHSSEIK